MKEPIQNKTDALKALWEMHRSSSDGPVKTALEKAIKALTDDIAYWTDKK